MVVPVHLHWPFHSKERPYNGSYVTHTSSRKATAIVFIIATMSKRKYDELSGTDEASAGGGWAALPPELLRGIGQALQSDARGLAAMERTCRPWRRVVMEGDNDPEIPGGGGDDGDGDDETKKAKPSLWRDLALAAFPRLASILKLVYSPDPNGRRRAIKGFSWKTLYRKQFQASRTQPVGPYQPTTKMSDYIFSFEFRDRGNELLFVTSCRGDETTPELWDQKVEYADEFNMFPVICQGPVDPRLVTRLGNNPFAEETLSHITAKVIVTRLSDMKAVELASKCWNPRDGEGSAIYQTDVDGNLVWEKDIATANLNKFLPVKASSSSVLMHLAFYLICESGCIMFEISHAELDDESNDVETSYCSVQSILGYLECHCPWPEN